MDDPTHLTAWQRLDAATTTSGFLTGADLLTLSELGTRTVINLALADHPRALADEAGQLAALGIAYHHIPVPFDAPGDDHFTAFCAALAEAERPLHVHCIFNWRVSAFFCRYHQSVTGMSATEARALMARQWDPAAHDHPDAPAWARFIATDQS